MIKINYEFKNQDLLNLALVQSGRDKQFNNERLEFLGDRVLGLVAAELLVELFPNENEGALAQRQAALVSGATLMQIAEGVNLFPNIKHSHLTANNRNNITADAMEAVFGAIYLDGGWDAARGAVRELILPFAQAYEVPPKDAKTELQELCHREFGQLPIYIYSDANGSSHNPEFVVEVRAGEKCAIGKGASKKAASLDAAEEMLRELKK
ncbi:MAG: ribonuclease III [Rickettsiales bacterium]|jgi:ribonuclease-3|nr:ribonuclease III [Rickettsiales bacterium]